ncbi:glyoxalase/bleomycin resistance protein/dioxygenase superfamily protein [Pacificibacter maritimus]|uniref:Glyoxalase/bleomycin resistance protein/dioxygenase superfamily protein n=1 Tax=Pacificibacter maritimus TaxID=762213 RepID=A0A3N4TWU7_9RHOB|nr:VOC family protein [Pacificibacter maritimus]RPE62942.1 glyoxalase/bleomycin resistance protein/dioxygenase superfamily protein [Pacificibacter maritimus]
MTFLVNDIGHIQLNVVDVESFVEEATQILGLRVTRAEADQMWLTAGGRDVEIVLHRADENSMRSLGFETPDADSVALIKERVEATGCKIVSDTPSLDVCEAGVSFTTPEGHLFEAHSPIKGHIYGGRVAPKGINAIGLDHVNILSPDPVATRNQLETIFGLRLSERLANDNLSWMRGGNGLHHILGVVRGITGLHHYSFEIEEFTDYNRLGDLLDTIDKQYVWGPGRHRPGDNNYAYYFDTCGAICEISHGMAKVTDEARFEPNVITNLKRPENVRDMNVWGTPAPKPWLEHEFPWAKHG